LNNLNCVEARCSLNGSDNPKEPGFVPKIDTALKSTKKRKTASCQELRE
jgi:hypothetical protein